MDREEHEEIQEQIRKGYLSKDLEPLKCFKCNGDNIKYENSYDGGYLIEQKALCRGCGQQLGLNVQGCWTV